MLKSTYYNNVGVSPELIAMRETLPLKGMGFHRDIVRVSNTELIQTEDGCLYRLGNVPYRELYVDGVVQVTGSATNLGILRSDGKLYTYQSEGGTQSDYKIRDLSTSLDTNTDVAFTTLYCNSSISNIKKLGRIDVSLAGSIGAFFFCIQENGDAYVITWGNIASLPYTYQTGNKGIAIKVPLNNVVDIVYNNNVAYYLTESGDVYCSSSSKDWTGRGIANTNTILKVPGLSNIVKMTMSYYFAAFLDVTGTIYVLGAETNDLKIVTLNGGAPQAIPSPSTSPVINIYISNRSLIATTADGSSWLIGGGPSSTYELIDTTKATKYVSADTWQQLEDLNIVKCSQQQGYVFIDTKGDFYAFRTSSAIYKGLGPSSDLNKVYPLHIDSTQYQMYKVEHHLTIRTPRGNVYTNASKALKGLHSPVRKLVLNKKIFKAFTSNLGSVVLLTTDGKLYTEQDAALPSCTPNLDLTDTIGDGFYRIITNGFVVDCFLNNKGFMYVLDTGAIYHSGSYRTSTHGALTAWGTQANVKKIICFYKSGVSARDFSRGVKRRPHNK